VDRTLAEDVAFEVSVLTDGADDGPDGEWRWRRSTSTRREGRRCSRASWGTGSRSPTRRTPRTWPVCPGPSRAATDGSVRSVSDLLGDQAAGALAATLVVVDHGEVPLADPVEPAAELTMAELTELVRALDPSLDDAR
jgi:hypothetical protein